MSNKQYNMLFFAGYIILIIGAVLFIFKNKFGFYAFGVGFLINTLFRIKLLPKTDDKRVRRLNGQQFIVVLCFVATAYLMYKNHSAWALPLLIAGVIDFFLSFRYPK